jgi:hypothetical protein
MIALFVLACSTPTPTPTPSPAPVAASHGDDHAHPGQHGGIVQVVGDRHVEALMMADGVLFWISDADEKPLPVDGFTAQVVVQGPDGVVTTEARPMGDHLHAMAKLVQGKPASVVLTLTKDGKAESASFANAAVGLKSHDHTALHGGEVQMRGNWHVEYAPGDGAYRFWLTDEFRNPLPEGVVATVTDGGGTTPLTLDPATGAFTATAEGAGTRPVKAEFTIGETRFSLDFGPKGHHH